MIDLAQFFYSPQLNEINMKLRDVISQLESNHEQFQKAKGEIVAKLTNLENSIEELKQALEDVELTPEQQAAVDQVAADAQALDDIIPDEPPVDEPPAVVSEN